MTRGPSAVFRLPRRLAAPVVLVVLAALAVVLGSQTPAAAALPTGFTEVTAFSGLVQPTAVRFAPDGRIFVAEKRGTIQMFDGLGDPTPTQVADLRTEVYNFWDRGLLGLAVDPEFPARPYLYALYTADAAIGGTPPRWGTPGTDSDPCPDPPGATTAGCVASGRLARLTLNNDNTSTENVLIDDWCQQFPSHTVDDLLFGADGALYASAGESANFNATDYGQFGGNPCGDPPGDAGGSMTPPAAQGGSLRAQDLRASGDPVGLDGTVIRISPDTGQALADNPNASDTDANARRIVAYGLRNPFRLAQRPGTGEIWIADVGANTWEEIDRLSAPTAGPSNFGWPCFEGGGRQEGFDAADLALCESLYTSGGATGPFSEYEHGRPLSASDTCGTAKGASISGLAFYPAGPYPAEYDGALFFSDYSRNCIWVMSPGTDGLPDPATVRPFLSPAAAPVDLQLSPQGELFYADFAGGTIRRIVYTGTDPSSCPSGQFLAQYFPNRTLTGTPAVSACEPAPLTQDWGTGSPAGVGPDSFSGRWTGSPTFPAEGTYEFTATADDGIRVWLDGAPLVDEWRNQAATTFRAQRALAAGPHQLRVEYYDATGKAVAKLGWAKVGGDAPPSPTIDTPPAGSTWKVGDQIGFSGSAVDPEDGALAPAALSWEMDLEHCPSACHTHVLQQWTGVSSGSIAAPDHEYPSDLVLRLTATDSAGQSTTVTRRLDPQTVAVTLRSQPAGLQLVLGQQAATTPFTSTVIAGSSTTLSAPLTQVLSGGTYRFASWSDGGSATHTVTAGATAATSTATYTLTSCAAGTYRVDYFANRTLSGAPAVSACEAAPLNHAWAYGGPPRLPVNNFSGRWSGSFTFPAGSRTFTASSDDGMRVWLDGTLIVNRWGGPGTTTVTRSLTAGAHTLQVEYFEATAKASVKLTW